MLLFGSVMTYPLVEPASYLPDYSRPVNSVVAQTSYGR